MLYMIQKTHYVPEHRLTETGGLWLWPQEFLEIVQEVQDRDELLELCMNEGLSDATDNI